jgi:hypothetical protein
MTIKIEMFMAEDGSIFKTLDEAENWDKKIIYGRLAHKRLVDFFVAGKLIGRYDAGVIADNIWNNRENVIKWLTAIPDDPS